MNVFFFGCCCCCCWEIYWFCPSLSNAYVCVGTGALSRRARVCNWEMPYRCRRTCALHAALPCMFRGWVGVCMWRRSSTYSARLTQCVCVATATHHGYGTLWRCYATTGCRFVTSTRLHAHTTHLNGTFRSTHDSVYYITETFCPVVCSLHTHEIFCFNCSRSPFSLQEMSNGDQHQPQHALFMDAGRINPIFNHPNMFHPSSYSINTNYSSPASDLRQQFSQLQQDKMQERLKVETEALIEQQQKFALRQQMNPPVARDPSIYASGMNLEQYRSLSASDSASTSSTMPLRMANGGSQMGTPKKENNIIISNGNVQQQQQQYGMYTNQGKHIVNCCHTIIPIPSFKRTICYINYKSNS